MKQQMDTLIFVGNFDNSSIWKNIYSHKFTVCRSKLYVCVCSWKMEVSGRENQKLKEDMFRM